MIIEIEKVIESYKQAIERRVEANDYLKFVSWLMDLVEVSIEDDLKEFVEREFVAPARAEMKREYGESEELFKQKMNQVRVSRVSPNARVNEYEEEYFAHLHLLSSFEGKFESNFDAISGALRLSRPAADLNLFRELRNVDWNYHTRTNSKTNEGFRKERGEQEAKVNEFLCELLRKKFS